MIPLSLNFQNLQPSSNYKYPKISKQSKKNMSLKLFGVFFFETKKQTIISQFVY